MGTNGPWRRRKGSDTWHFCRNCSSWPTFYFEEKDTEPTSDDFCSECRSKASAQSCS